MAKFYITDAIPYTNAPAHIGHALEFVQSDVLARYHRQLGDDVLLTHGADEHGTKIYEKAQAAGVEPKEFVDQVTSTFQEAHKRLNISFDRFVRTSSDEHRRTVQAVWQKLLDNGDIYKGTYSGWYCVGCEEFVTEGHARDNNNFCPAHQQPYQKLEEENYFFKLASYTDRVKKAIEDDEYRVVPEARKNEILSTLGSGLDDTSISRPAAKLPWGVPVPNDKNHVIYVWFEALINYITALGYPDGEDFAQYWPADVHIIGKDIIRFHAAIWPAMLLALGVELPKSLYVHGMINSGGRKMSKTIGNVIDPFAVVDEYGLDPLRYYLLRHIPSDTDGDFTYEQFERAYNGELANDLGNLVQRLKSMISRYQNGVIGEFPSGEHDVAPYHAALQDFKFDRALDHVWGLIHGLNQYLEETKPWEAAKGDDAAHVQEILAYAVGSLLQVSRLLSPFLPETSNSITRIFDSGVIDESVPTLFPRKHLYTPEKNHG